MSSEVVARFQHVVKEYRLGQERSNVRALIPGRRGELSSVESFRAVDDLSFELEPGQALGIIGHNGAGKSTVLRLLAGIVEPTRGRVDVFGKAASLIELGVGFDEELTGAENIYFAGDLFGITRSELRKSYDDIVEFSGISEFLDMPVKRYSTGMRARLGFSLATAVPCDLLIVDEVLSVGDYEFQRRSFERIRDMHQNGTALVLVSHNLWMVDSLCDRALLLERGQVVVDGRPPEAISAYIGPDVVAEPDPEVEAPEYVDYQVPPELAGRIEISSLAAVPARINPGDPITIRAVVEVKQPCEGLVVMSLFTSERAVYAEREPGPSDFLTSTGTWTIEARIPSVPLATGRFQFRVAVLPSDDRRHEQAFPAALASASVDFSIIGDVTARPGLRLETVWSATSRSSADA